jgi:hypothetical protein
MVSINNILGTECKLILLTGKGFHPFHILFARMSITVACSSLYMWLKKTEHFPWGLREVRGLLVARGLAGFFGVFGMYCKYPHSFILYDNVLEEVTPSNTLSSLEHMLNWLYCCTVLGLTVSSIVLRSNTSG